MLSRCTRNSANTESNFPYRSVAQKGLGGMSVKSVQLNLSYNSYKETTPLSMLSLFPLKFMLIPFVNILFLPGNVIYRPFAAAV